MTMASLEEMLRALISLERKLNLFYLKLKLAVTSDKSRAIVDAFQKRQERAVDLLREIGLREFRHSGFIQTPPERKDGESIPRLGLFGGSSSIEILEKILGYEEKLLQCYIHLKDITAYQNSRELIEMLVKFKLGQVKQIKRFMVSYELIV